MSTPTFAPGLFTRLPTHLPTFNQPPTTQQDSKNGGTDYVQTTATVTATAATPKNTTSSLSSPTSNASTASTELTSPSSEALTSSSILGGAASFTSTTGGGTSDASAPTTASPGSFVSSKGGQSVSRECVRMDEDTPANTVAEDDTHAPATVVVEERPASAASRALAGLSVEEKSSDRLHVDTGDDTRAAGKTRRASVLSATSAQQTEESAWLAGKGGRDSQPARKKAPRMGSFETRSAAEVAAGTGSSVERQASSSTTATQDDNPQGPVASTSGSASYAPVPSASTAFEPPPEPQQHVDIVSYPSNDLLKLLASLLEQIAHANDALHQRTQLSRSGSTSPEAYSNETPAAFQSGRFDAAPLNSPATPRYRNDNEHRNDQAEDDVPGELPVTPGVDLLREVGAGGGVEGFMPSLGGAHQPQPLSRRRGSSFLKRKEEHPPIGRRASAMVEAGPTAATTSASAATMSAASSALSSTPADAPLTALFTASSQALSSPSATLCFHARNVPAISIEAYLLRILKYCPTTNEVFLSLLVYFDRMARVGLEAQRAGIAPSGSKGKGRDASGSGGAPTDAASRLFAIDSFNVHRLVIAGVTVASKFFSDVFYTNSRYAKVGGLPLTELNQLELQFLLLNDFRLVVPVDELQRYADQLILFWVGRNGASATGPPAGAPSHQQQHFPAAPPLQPTMPQPTNGPTTVDPSATYAQPASSQQSHQRETAHPHQPPSQSQDAPHSTDHTPSSHQARPQSVRSQPSSSGTSVASTVTPGSPDTARHQFPSEEDDGSGGGGGGGGGGAGQMSSISGTAAVGGYHRYSDEEDDERDDDEGRGGGVRGGSSYAPDSRMQSVGSSSSDAMDQD